MSLAEMLAAAAITTVVILTATSLLLTTLLNKRVVQKQTDVFEALRLPASLVTQDARFATKVVCDPTLYLQLYTNSAFTDYVKYVFATTSIGRPPIDPPDEDPQHLHRWVVKGGTVERDDIVGWNLVKVDFNDPNPTDFTAFGCAADPRPGLKHSNATAHLVKKLVTKTGSKLFILDTTGFLRSY